MKNMQMKVRSKTQVGTKKLVSKRKLLSFNDKKNTEIMNYKNWSMKNEKIKS
jgi:hypothetical protein